MKAINTSPISGTQELLPARQAIFDQLKEEIARVYRAHGFQAIETPIIDRTEILLAKAGGDTEKQIYKVAKTTESFDDADQALRFDHTVPLARYVVEHESNLVFPFKATQIGRNFRGERAQKGRFREFYQCDMDIIGRNELPLAYDAEVILTFLDAAKAILPKTYILVRVSNRKLLAGLCEELGISNKLADVSSIIDHVEKVAPEKTAEALNEIGLDEMQKAKINQFMQIRGTRAVAMRALENMQIRNETFQTGMNELDEVLRLADLSEISADMGIVRGLDYYTGTVFETILPEYRGIGSIGGGGRYENLTGFFTEQKFPGVGGSIGLTRLFYILSEYGLVSKDEDEDENDGRMIDYAIIPITPNENEVALELAKRLRDFYSYGCAVDTILTEKRLGDKMTYASKIARAAIVVGEEEAKNHAFMVKNFSTGETRPLKIDF